MILFELDQKNPTRLRIFCLGIPRIEPSGLHKHRLTDMVASFMSAACKYIESDVSMKYTMRFKKDLSVHVLIVWPKQDKGWGFSLMNTCKGKEQDVISHTLNVFCASLSRDPTSQMPMSPTFVPTKRKLKGYKNMNLNREAQCNKQNASTRTEVT